MSLPLSAHPMYFGVLGVNTTTLAVAFIGLIAACIYKAANKGNRLFEWTLLVSVLSFTFLTLHGRLIQTFLPISLPEQPLLDNNLTLNYLLTNVLAYAVIPFGIVVGLDRHLPSWAELGFKGGDRKKTVVYTVFGAAVASAVYLVTNFFFHEQWVGGYTQTGLALWVILVSVVAVGLQVFFFAGILFNRYVGAVNGALLGVMAVLAYQSFVGPNWLPWQVCSIISFSTELYVTWKTRSLYGAILIAITVSLIELTLQLL